MLKKIVIVIVLLVVVLFLYLTQFRKDLTLSKAAVKATYSLPNSKFISWQSSEIHYTESGKGFPILMIHGFGGSNRDFYTLDSLVNDKYRVIRVDMPGFGLSDFPQQSGKEVDYIQVYDKFFSFMLDTLHIDSCYVIGNSLGGLMAWNLAVKHPKVVKKLVLLNSAGYDMEEVLKTANAAVFRYKLVQMLLKRGLPKYLTARGAKRIVYNASILSEDRIQRLNDFWNREGNLPHLMAMACSQKYLDQNLIKQVSCPTLILWGKQDKIVSVKYADRFHQDIKNSQEIIYDSCGHVPMMERPLDVQRDVLRFLGAPSL